MNSPGTVRIPLDRIDVGPRLRKVDPDYVEYVAASMAEIGQMTPIEVRQVGHANAHRYRLVAGAHRVEGARRNNWTEIEARIVKVTDLQAEMREIDENLFRRDLNALDRAIGLARRRELYLELHPETAQGKANHAARQGKTTFMSFSKDVASRLNVTPRDIQRAIARSKIVPDVREKISATWIARKATELDALVRLTPDEQRKIVKLMLQEAHPAPSVAAARKALSGEMAPVKGIDDQQYEKLLSAWRKAGAKARRSFIDHLQREGVLDAPGGRP
jgi:ParB family transcriptional regulator, chromosome partitioning protein